jgi:hypothetical protein
MTPRTDGERLAVLEWTVKAIKQHQDAMELKIDEMHAVLLQAKGVRWIVGGTILIVSSMAAAGFYLVSLLHMR